MTQPGSETELQQLPEQPQPLPPRGPKDPRAARHPLIYRFFIEYNPFYLLSAACMLGSLLALTNSLSWNPIATRRLITLIITLNVYEAALLGIALFLVARRKLQRDGTMLLVLQAFFVADFAFLNAEIATVGLALGIIINIILLVLAAVKLGVVIRVLKPAFTSAQFAFVIFQLAVLFAIPCVLRAMELNRMMVGPKQFYALWWIAGLFPAIYELVATWDPRRPTLQGAITPQRMAQPGYAVPTRAWLALPYVAFLTHVGILHYVYGVRFYGAHAAPVLLGLTLVLNRFSPTSLLPRKDLLSLRLLLPIAAILVSANNPFIFPLGLKYPNHTFTPLNITLAAAFVLYVYCFVLNHARIWLACGAAAEALYILGPSRQTVGKVSTRTWEQGTNVLDKLTPRDLSDWGLIGLVASFVLLGLGFWVSLRKRPHSEHEPENPVATPDTTPAPPMT